MSVVANVILMTSPTGYDKENGDPMLNEINSFFKDEQRGFVSVDEPTLPHGWYGGSKMFECELYLGAFNYLDLSGLLRHLMKIDWLKWGQYMKVQMAVKEQDDHTFRLIDIPVGDTK